MAGVWEYCTVRADYSGDGTFESYSRISHLTTAVRMCGAAGSTSGSKIEEGTGMSGAMYTRYSM